MTDPTRTNPATVRLDIGVLQEIESCLCLDTFDPAVVWPLIRREEAQEHRGWPPAPADPDLEDDIAKALDGEWLYLYEIAPLLRLRGWNRLRYGQITVKVRDMHDASWALGLIVGGLGGECEDQLRQLDYEGDGIAEIREAVKAQLAKDGTCGECLWCQVRRLSLAIDMAMWDAGVELGLEFRMYVLGQPHAQAVWEAQGYRMPGYNPDKPQED